MVARPWLSLHDFLMHQLSRFEVDQATKDMVERVIFSLDSNGYLKSPLAELIDPDGRPAQLALAERALAIIHKLDPPGVGARDLRECLLLQLTPGMLYYEQMRTLISDHLVELENNRLPEIERRAGYSIDLIKSARSELRKLKPKPGADFNEGR